MIEDRVWQRVRELFLCLLLGERSAYQAQRGYCQVNRLKMQYIPDNPLMRTSFSLYHRHRFPAEIISHCVWLYFRFALSFRDVEEMLAMRGVALTYETVREWCLKFGQTYANGLRRGSPPPRGGWYLYEGFSLSLRNYHLTLPSGET